MRETHAAIRAFTTYWGKTGSFQAIRHPMIRRDMVSRRICKPKVGGSNPSPGTKGWCPYRDCLPFERVHHRKRAERRFAARGYVQDVMKHGFILGGQRGGAGRSADCAAQRSRAGADPGIPAGGSGACGARPAAKHAAEIPPPAPSPSYVWEPGHWSWNGVQYLWQPRRYVERPAVSATYTPGHWEQQANGWVWVEGRWDYPGVGSSTPPAWYPSAR